jgi:hypothetical protein
MKNLIFFFILATTMQGQPSSYTVELDDLEINSTVCFSSTDCREMSTVRLKNSIYIVNTVESDSDEILLKLTSSGIYQLYYNEEKMEEYFVLNEYKELNLLVLQSIDWQITIQYYE